MTDLEFHLAEKTHVRIGFTGPVDQAAIAKMIELLEVSRDAFPEHGDEVAAEE